MYLTQQKALIPQTRWMGWTRMAGALHGLPGFPLLIRQSLRGLGHPVLWAHSHLHCRK